MGLSSITLYKGCKVLKDKNFVVEGLDDYLNTLSSVYIGDFQYVKNDLNVTIKINLDQANLSGDLIFDESYNYLKLVMNNEDNWYYYFIDSRKWVAKNTVALELTQDILNTYHLGTSYSLSKKTQIQRQHKDRVEKRHDIIQTGTAGTSVTAYDWQTVGQYSFAQMSMILEDAPVNVDLDFDIRFIDRQPASFTYQYTKANRTLVVFLTSTSGPMMITSDITWTYTEDSYVRKIDFLSEGITPQKYHDTDLDAEINEQFDTSWNLVYMSDENKETAIRCLMFPDDNVTIKVHGGINSLTPSTLVAGNYYYLTDGEYDLIDEASGNKIGDIYYRPATYLPAEKSWAVVYVQNNSLSVIMHKTYRKTTSRPPYYEMVDTNTTVSGLNSIKLNSNENVKYQRSTTLTTNYETAKGYSQYTFSQAAFTEQPLKSIDSLDRTDSKLIKIIKLPYCPSPIKIENGSLIMDGPEWTYEPGFNCLELTDLNIKFSKDMNLSDSYNPYSDFRVDINPKATDLRNDIAESKLYHSDFYQPKFVYDSFGFNFALETMKNNNISDDFKMSYYVTSTINSKFAFKFDDYKCKYGTQDYNNVLNISRNNEMTIYNSEYLNYIKVGYNYDKKAKEAQLGQSIATTALSVAGGVALGALKGSAGGVGGIAAGAAIGLVGGIIGTISSQVSAENSMNQKLDQYKNQATSVQGADDIDLLEAYSNNRAKVIKYECSDTMKSLLGDLFYYCGYVENVQNVPNVNSRYWFNFIQCEPDIIEPGNINKNIIDNLKLKYNEGVTFMHCHRDLAGQNPQWDLDQVKENWEVSVL